MAVARLRGLVCFWGRIPGVPLTLHLGLYASARIRGLRYKIRALC